jgi:hypothetical protein
MTARSMILPIALTVVGVALAAGCIYVPTFGMLKSGTDASKRLGDADDAKRPLRVDAATRADVERLLGPPQYVSADGTEIAYTWTALDGFWIPACGKGSIDVTSLRFALLRFDGRAGAGVLRGFRIDKHMSRLNPWVAATSATQPAPQPIPTEAKR